MEKYHAIMDTYLEMRFDLDPVRDELSEVKNKLIDEIAECNKYKVEIAVRFLKFAFVESKLLFYFFSATTPSMVCCKRAIRSSRKKIGQCIRRTSN